MYAHQTRISGHAVFTNMLTIFEMSLERLLQSAVASSNKKQKIENNIKTKVDYTVGRELWYIRFASARLVSLFIGVILLNEELTRR